MLFKDKETVNVKLSRYLPGPIKQRIVTNISANAHLMLVSERRITTSDTFDFPESKVVVATGIGFLKTTAEFNFEIKVVSKEKLGKMNIFLGHIICKR